MVPIMIQENEFVIAVTDDISKISVRNPHGQAGETRFTLIKVMLDGMMKNTIKVAAGSEPGANMILNLKETTTYKELVELKVTYERLRVLLRSLGVDLTLQDETAYNMVCVVLEKIEREVSQAARSIIETPIEINQQS